MIVKSAHGGSKSYHFFLLLGLPDPQKIYLFLYLIAAMLVSTDLNENYFMKSMYNVNQLVLDIIEYIGLVTLFLVNNKFELFHLSLTIFEAFLH